MITLFSRYFIFFFWTQSFRYCLTFAWSLVCIYNFHSLCSSYFKAGIFSSLFYFEERCRSRTIRRILSQHYARHAPRFIHMVMVFLYFHFVDIDSLRSFLSLYSHDFDFHFDISFIFYFICTSREFHFRILSLIFIGKHHSLALCAPFLAIKYYILFSLFASHEYKYFFFFIEIFLSNNTFSLY